MGAGATRRYALDGGLIALATAAGLVLWPRLPAEMAVHFTASGTPDSFLPRVIGVFLVPAIMVATLAILRGAARIDPPADQRVFTVVSSGTMGLLAAVHLFVLAWNLGYDVPVNAVVAGSIVWALALTGYAFTRKRSLIGA